MKTKMVIVMRKDLNMRKGKMIAQGAHASLGIFSNLFDQFSSKIYLHHYHLDVSPVMHDWLQDSYRKICVGCNSAEELLEIKRKAVEANIPCVVIEDNGLTEFKGVKTMTCLTLGPGYDDEIDKITGHLKLL